MHRGNLGSCPIRNIGIEGRSSMKCCTRRYGNANRIGRKKSTTLANWIEKRKEYLHKDEFLFQHYVSCSQRSSELQYTLHRLATLLKDHF